MTVKKAELTAAQRATAAKIVAGVLLRVPGVDALAETQAKYIAKNRAISVGLDQPQRELLIEEINQAIENEFDARANRLPPITTGNQEIVG